MGFQQCLSVYIGSTRDRGMAVPNRRPLLAALHALHMVSLIDMSRVDYTLENSILFLNICFESFRFQVCNCRFRLYSQFCDSRDPHEHSTVGSWQKRKKT